MDLNADEEISVELIDTTLTQHWRRDGASPNNNIGTATKSADRNVTTPVSVRSAKLQRMHSRESAGSSGRRSRISEINVPATVVVSTSATRYSETLEGDTSDEFDTKRKRSRPPSHKIESSGSSIRTTNTTFTPSKYVAKSLPYEHCFRLEMKLNDLRSKISRLKNQKEKLREKQLLIHQMSAADTDFQHSSER